MTEFLLEEIEALVEPVLDEMGIELVDLEYFSGHGRQVLRIYADRPTGITLDDCAMVSREIGHLLDVSDLLQHQYVLEVSSPGLNRPLKREKDFFRVVGQQIKVQTTAPLKGRSNFSGVLQSVENGMLKIDLGDAVVQIPAKSIRKANLVFDFHNQG
ncbi:MAG: ribosome maturation factor RimP [Deltaproteobacteria bacterium]|nr:ribosome maturation factor RimP [Deltaproteobacteria bacterium]